VYFKLSFFFWIASQATNDKQKKHPKGELCLSFSPVILSEAKDLGEYCVMRFFTSFRMTGGVGGMTEVRFVIASLRSNPEVSFSRVRQFDMHPFNPKFCFSENNHLFCRVFFANLVNNMVDFLLFFRILFFLFLFGLSSCSSHKETEGNIIRIDISKVEKRKYLNASEVISGIEYVALETSSSCLVGESITISVTDNYILIFSKNCFLFSREGKFIRRIGQKGNGPSDFIGDTYWVKIDEKSDMLYLMNYSEIVAYRITGEFVKKMNFIELAKRVNTKHLENITHWKDNLFCSHINISSGKEPFRFIIFNLEGEIVNLFPNYIFFKKENPNRFVVYNSNIHIFNEKLYFKELPGDTLFQVFDHEMVPEVIFKLSGSKRHPDMIYNHPDAIDIRVPGIVENYLWLQISTIGDCLYDKKHNRLIAFESDALLSNEINLPDMSTYVYQLRGLRNDIDGGLPFLPRRYSIINNNNQLVCLYQAYVLKNNFTEEHFARQKIKDPEAHKRLRKLLSELDEEDNPVLMIATFK